MKIIRMKKPKDKQKKDMFVILCITQSITVILIVLSVFVLSRINPDEYSAFREDIGIIFDDDKDIGGYFTPSEEKDEAITTDALYFVSYEDTINTEKPVNIQEADEVISEITAESISVINTSADCEDIFGVVSSEAVMPVRGKVTSDYGYREHPVYSGESFHSGRDIAAAEGTDIYAVLDGVVSEAGNAPQAGNFIRIDHNNGIETLYCHCSKLYVSEGVRVRKGEVIAAVGETGLATGPHLHFELHENSKAVDPAKILSGAVNVY